jgi:hypothetical protein
MKRNALVGRAGRLMKIDRKCGAFCVRMCVCVCIKRCMYINTYIYMYIYMYVAHMRLAGV